MGLSLALIVAASGFLYVVEAESPNTPDVVEAVIQTPVDITPVAHEPRKGTSKGAAEAPSDRLS